MCYLCGEPGHFRRECPKNNVASYPLVQGGVVHASTDEEWGTCGVMRSCVMESLDLLHGDVLSPDQLHRDVFHLTCCIGMCCHLTCCMVMCCYL